jgi:hydroxymethylpyrimidine pyrophosphatase-like HAD family hydrolase
MLDQKRQVDRDTAWQRHSMTETKFPKKNTEGLIRLSVLALDYDGTIATSGVLNNSVRTALREVRRTGVNLILVTGRRIAELQRLVGNLDLFEAIVAENGAVVAYPSTGRSTLIGQPPPPYFLQELRNRGIPAEAGECVVEAAAAEAGRILAVIRELELPLVIAFNRGRLMVLPTATSKATGLGEALRTLRLSAHNALAIGDAENDHDLLAACEVGVAVHWGSPVLQLSADLVLDGTGPEDVADYILQVAATKRLPTPKTARRRLQLGTQEDGSDLSLAVRGRSILISGDPKSGKSWIAGLICEQLILQRYSVFVIDPEGDYTSLEALPGVLVFGEEKHPPPLTELTRVLHHHDVSIVADFSMLPQADKRRYARSLLHLLAEHRRRTGLPHRIVVDEAHYFLHDPDVLDLVDVNLSGYILVTYRAAQLHPRILGASEAIIVSRETDPEELRALFGLHKLRAMETQLAPIVQNLALDEAVLFPGIDEAGGRLRKFRVAQRLSYHVRHRHKYFDVPVPTEQAFVFSHGGHPPARARTLKEFLAALSQITDEALAGYLQRHDYSRWIDDVFGDYALASQIEALENQNGPKQIQLVRNSIVRLIQERYSLSDSEREPLMGLS